MDKRTVKELARRLLVRLWVAAGITAGVVYLAGTGAILHSLYIPS